MKHIIPNYIIMDSYFFPSHGGKTRNQPVPEMMFLFFTYHIHSRYVLCLWYSYTEWGNGIWLVRYEYGSQLDTKITYFFPPLTLVLRAVETTSYGCKTPPKRNHQWMIFWNLIGPSWWYFIKHAVIDPKIGWFIPTIDLPLGDHLGL